MSSQADLNQALNPSEGAISALPSLENKRYKLYTDILCWFMRVYFKIEMQGIENLPAAGPGIIVANHQSYLDIPLIGTALIKRQLIQKTYWVIGKPTYQNPYLQFLFRTAPVIVVNGTVHKADMALKKGCFITIFPEGFYTWHKHRARCKNEPLPQKIIGRSAAILGLKTGVPITPIGIAGTEEAMPPYAAFARPGRLKLRFGEPFCFQRPEPEEVTEAMIDEKSQFIMQKIDMLR